MINKAAKGSEVRLLGGFYRFSSCSLRQLLPILRNKMPPPGPYSGTSTLSLVARASAFSLGLVYGSIKLGYLKAKAKSHQKAEAKAHH